MAPQRPGALLLRERCSALDVRRPRRSTCCLVSIRRVATRLEHEPLENGRTHLDFSRKIERRDHDDV